MASRQSGARALFAGASDRHDFLIGEMPRGVFNVWLTTPIPVAAFERTLTAGDALAQSPPVFLRAWLQLADAGGAHGIGAALRRDFRPLY